MVLRSVIVILGFLVAMAVMTIVVEAGEYEHHELSRRRFRDMVLWLLFVVALVILVVFYFHDLSSGSPEVQMSPPVHGHSSIP